VQVEAQFAGELVVDSHVEQHVCIRQHTSASVSIRQHTLRVSSLSIRTFEQHVSRYDEVSAFVLLY
jgi:hypothetical protein